MEGRDRQLILIAPGGGSLFRAWSQNSLAPAAQRAYLDGITYHGLRQSFVAIMVASPRHLRGSMCAHVRVVLECRDTRSPYLPARGFR